MRILSKRVNDLEGSGIRKVFDLAAKSKGEIINLSIGQPDFDVSESLKQSAKCAINANKNAYTQTSGVVELKKKIVEKLKKENEINACEGEIIITNGVSGSIFLLLCAILNPGDEVILPDPYFVVYEQIIKFLDAKAVLLDTYPDFHIDACKLKKLVTNKTKVIVVNTPNNPTGVVYSRAELESVAEIAKKNDLLVIADEIYEYYDYENKFFSIGSIYSNTVTLNGYSKSHAITGWRVGYAHGPKDIIESMNKLQQYTFVCAPSFAQHALAGEQEFSFEETLEKYKHKRDFVYENLKDKYDLFMPEGAFYAFVKIPDRREKFIEELAEKGVLVVPGSVFSRNDTHFRICYAVKDDLLEKGIDILKNLV